MDELTAAKNKCAYLEGLVEGLIETRDMFAAGVEDLSKEFDAACKERDAACKERDASMAREEKALQILSAVISAYEGRQVPRELSEHELVIAAMFYRAGIHTYPRPTAVPRAPIV